MRGSHIDLNPVAVVRSDSLRFLDELVIERGANPQSLCMASRIDPAVITNLDHFIPFRDMILLLDRVASDLRWPDFGLQLALRQYEVGIAGPLDVAMRNCARIGEAWRYCIEHIHAYSSGIRLSLHSLPERQQQLIKFEILVQRMGRQTQAVEHAVLYSQKMTSLFSAGRVSAAQACFTHAPIAPRRDYEQAFACDVRFNHPFNALIFSDSAMDEPVANSDQRLLDLARFYIERTFPRPNTLLASKVRSLIDEALVESDCTNVHIAEILGVHPRTMQRRLQAEGESFELIKDDVRRQKALHYLTETRMPLKTIVDRLGYRELSAFQRSCRRWFDMPPTGVRDGKMN